ncbi:HNH endonuclease [Stenotrophomonas maltophilia]|uniref:HNH endonuclease n=1 Tax=Stenotrophomonas maltophilia TaxID=40324 RepID=UPI003202A94B|nr:HNH endonuclease [Stenotrophomonas maltophilia]
MSLARPIAALLDKANAIFSYNPETGLIVRRVTCGGRCAGTVVGTRRDDGYLEARVAGRTVLAHRLAWLLITQEEPPAEIDHINGRKDDNRFKNLRGASRAENNQNRVVPHANNRTGRLGVHRNRSGRFVARIRVDGRLQHIGVYATPDEASDAYLRTKRQLHRGNTL